MAAKLELRDIVVRRGQTTTLTVERLNVEAGQVLAVLGPNGAGKTTLLQVAGLLLRPARGEVLLDGVPAGRDALALRRRIAVAMQDALLVEGSVLDNVALGLKLRGVAKREREERAGRWLRRFGIEGVASRPAGKLSGGEAQRASLARAFAVEPELLLLDEPFGGLDQPTRSALLDDLDSVLRETGVATIFVTHDRDEALRLADRVAVVLDGRLRQEGPAATVFGAPADEEVAAFVGVETIVPGRVLEVRDGLATVDVAGHAIFAVAATALPETVRVCLRPEDIVFQLPSGEARTGSARNLLPGIIREVRVLGPEARVVLDCAPSTGSRPLHGGPSAGESLMETGQGPSTGSGQGFRLVGLVTKLSVEDLGLAPGVKVGASFKATAVHLLPGHGEGR